MKKNVFLSIALVCFFTSAFSQSDVSPFPASASGFSITSFGDYQSLSVNPANLGFDGPKKIHFGLGDLSGGFYSQPLSRKEIFNDLFAQNISFNETQRSAAVEKFANSRVLFNANINLLGFSYQTKKLGGFAFAVREKISFNLIMNHFTSEMLFLGWNANYFDQKVRDANGAITSGLASNPQSLAVLGYGSEANVVWLREYVLGYGKSLIDKENFKLNIGFSARYIQGFAFAQYFTHADKSDLYSGISTSVNLDLGPNTLSPADGKITTPVGKGVGFDFGLSGEIAGKFKWGITLADIGQVNWFGNVYKGANVDFTDIESGGINSYNLFTEATDIDGIAGFDWENITPVDRKLPMNLRLGGSYKLGKIIELGGEFYYPLIKDVPGAYRNPIYSFGSAFHLGNVHLHAGFNYNEYYGMSTPIGAVFQFGKKKSYEIGIGSRDFLGLFQQNNPGISLVMGLVRVSF